MVSTVGSGLQKIMEMLAPENEGNIAAEMKKIKDMMKA